jgi:phosphate transport system substrate-binding protein
MFSPRRLSVCLSLLLALPVVAGSRAHAAPKQQTLQIKGSDTMVNLVQAWAEVFMETHPEVFAAVTGGGSGTGIAALIGKTCDIAACSRAMTEQELETARAKGSAPQQHIVALDGIAVVVHPGNPVRQLTLEQLRAIFTGAVTNWQQVGGKDQRIVVLSREVNSGTHVFFKEHVLQRGAGYAAAEFVPAALLLSSSQAVADEVAQNPQAIGYYGMGYLSPQQRVMAVGNSAQGPFIAPTSEAVRQTTYPISRPLYLYTNGEPAGAVKLFMDFVASPKGQAIVAEQDFVSLK